MFKLLFSVFAFLQLQNSIVGQSIKPVLIESAPSAAGASEERLKRVDQFIQQYVDDKQINGATAIIVRDGKIIYHKAFGFSDIQQKKTMQKENIFRIASMTKPIISVAAMMLYEEGKFSLDDPISKFIPAFKSPKVIDKYNAGDTSYTTIPAKSEITVRQLMNHTSGIGYAQIGSAFANAIYYKHHINGGIGTPYSNLREMINRLATLPLFHHPGEKFLYGLNTDVLGYLVEVISGMPLDKYLSEKIFLPLGMNDTYFFIPKEKQYRLVNLYQQDNQGRLRMQDSIIKLNGDFYRDFPKTPNGSYFSGGAGLSATAYDYAIFAQMLINGGEYNGKRLLSPHTIRIMTQNQIGERAMWGSDNDPYRFGLGFGVYTEKSEAIVPVYAGTYDWAGMFASHFWVDPKARVVAVFMRNVWPTNHWDFGDRVKSVVYQALND